MEIKVVTKRNFEIQDLRTCAKLLSEAFQDEPGLNWLCPRELHYLWFYETARLVMSSQTSELIFVEGSEGSMACALVTHPKFFLNFINRIVWIWKIWSNCGWRVISKTFQYLKRTEKAKAQNDSCLEFIGVSRRYRGRGLSSTLIEHINKKIDNRQLFLTTADSKNVSLYQHLGFKIVSEDLDFEVNIFAMRRA